MSPVHKPKFADFSFAPAGGDITLLTLLTY